MSHFRRNAGRFSTHTATEAYQRQLATPVHKWKKAWVSPSGLQPESSYKICKWVRVPKDELDEPEDDVNEDGMTPAGDDDEDMENADENEGDEEEGDGEGGEDEGDDEGKETDTPANEAAPAVDEEVPTAPAESLDNLAADPSNDDPRMAAGPALVPASSMITSTEGTSTEGQDATAASALLEPAAPQHTEIPSNAIEISNIAPGHTEQGTGDLGGTGPGVEMHVAEPPSGDVDMLGGGEGLATEPAVAADPPAADEGLVHGEMEQPKEMDDGAPPPEVERP